MNILNLFNKLKDTASFYHDDNGECHFHRNKHGKEIMKGLNEKDRASLAQEDINHNLDITVEDYSIITLQSKMNK